MRILREVVYGITMYQINNSVSLALPRNPGGQLKQTLQGPESLRFRALNHLPLLILGL